MQTNTPIIDIPTLQSERLVLRAWAFTDCDQIDNLINDEEIARMTSSVPFPYLSGSAFGFIATQRGKHAAGQSYSFAVTSKDSGQVLGSSGVFKRKDTGSWELGYWIGRKFWNQGFASEATQITLDWASKSLGIDTCLAGHFEDNPASGKILAKLGFGKISEDTVPMYSLARGGKDAGLMYAWPKESAAKLSLAALH